MKIEKETKMITREFLQSLTFRQFTANDYMGFGGVQSPVPMIAETEKYLVILDGDYCEVYGDSTDGNFEPIDTVDSVTSLPY